MSKATVDLMHLIKEYGRKHDLRGEVVIHLADDHLQMIEKETCGIYQIYFYVNLFNPLENSSILSEKTLSRKTIEKLLKEVLSTDKQENEYRTEIFVHENNIKRN